VSVAPDGVELPNVRIISIRARSAVGICLVVNNPDLAVRAAMDGLGVAYTVVAQAEPFLRSGQLVRVGPLQSCPWAGAVLEGEALVAVGHAAVGGLLCAVPMRSDDRPNEFGVKGMSAAAKPFAGKSDRLGCGQHGGLGAWEQMPFLMIEASSFERGAVQGAPTSVIDLAPTILGHLGISADGCEGRPIQQR
jgi:hypothetical protein